MLKIVFLKFLSLYMSNEMFGSGFSSLPQFEPADIPQWISNDYLDPPDALPSSLEFSKKDLRMESQSSAKRFMR
jgi:hypothetical protein